MLPTLLIFTLLLIFASPSDARQKILIYSRTAGYRHPSIPNAVAALQKISRQNNIDYLASENQNHFDKDGWLNQFDALVFVSVSGEALNPQGQVNMMKYIEAGGGYFGIHEACDALYHSPWYGRLVGAYFNYHPYLQKFTLDVQTHNHPSTSFLNKTWDVLDEVYNFNSNPRKLGKTLVLTADPTSFKDPGGESVKQIASVEGNEHPIAWYKEGNLLDDLNQNVGGGVDDTSSTPKNQQGTGGDGRSFFTALGHTKACWTDDTFLQHISGALSWVLESPSIRSNNASLPSSAPGSDPVSSITQNSTASNSSNNNSSGGSSRNGKTASNSTSSSGIGNGTLKLISAAPSSTLWPVQHVHWLLASLLLSSTITTVLI